MSVAGKEQESLLCFRNSGFTSYIVKMLLIPKTDHRLPLNYLCILSWKYFHIKLRASFQHSFSIFDKFTTNVFQMELLRKTCHIFHLFIDF